MQNSNFVFINCSTATHSLVYLLSVVRGPFRISRAELNSFERDRMAPTLKIFMIWSFPEET